MSLPDAAAQAAIAEDVVRPVWLGFLDILGDPIRVTTAPFDVSFAGTGDPDLDGQTFRATDPTWISVSPVIAKEGGGDQVTVTLSGILGIDTDLLNQIGAKANWQGRDARLWAMVVDEANQRIGGVWNYYTGVMMVPKIVGDRHSQTIQLTVDSYLAFIGEASNRTYLSQAEYDPGDLSAAASIAIANGTSGAGLSGGGGGGGDLGSLRDVGRLQVRRF